jgi:hypothetical protein
MVLLESYQSRSVVAASFELSGIDFNLAYCIRYAFEWKSYISFTLNMQTEHSFVVDIVYFQPIHRYIDSREHFK